MNERIRQLAEQAKFMAEEDINRQISYNTELKAFAEKFAELIVKECATLTLDPMQIDDAQYYHGWLDYRDKIWKHFGVGK